jgi:hypothetical protein
MSFNNNIPQPGDNLSDSQGQLLVNNISLNNSFGVDHYTFNDLTANNGKHNQVTTPLITPLGHPTTIANEPKFYAMQDTMNLGVLQYSRGGSNAVPTPITFINSTAAGISMPRNTTINLLDFVGVIVGIFEVFAVGKGTAPTVEYRTLGTFYWDGTSFTQFGNGVSSLALQIDFSGSIVQLTNLISSPSVLSNVYWTIRFIRIQTS